MQKHYKTLGLNHNREYTFKEIKEAWRKKCIETHPDKGGSDEAFNEVTHSFNYLTDPSYRQNHVERKVNLHVKMQVPITFEEGFFGTILTLNYGQNTLDENGNILGEDVYRVETITLAIPPGTCGPTEMFVGGKGLRCGESIGDVFITIVPRQHPKFRIIGFDVVSPELIPLKTLLKGGVVEVETMYGIRDLKVPPGTEPETRLYLKGNGVGHLGSHVVICCLKYPTKEELKEEEWRGLEIKWEI